MEGLTNEEEDMIFETNSKLFSIGTIVISNEIVSLLSVRVIKIRINGNSTPEQRLLDQGAIEAMVSTIKTKKFNVSSETSLQNKVYLETYYHHNQVDIKVDETLTKIQVHNL
jgi:hypothetical protein